MDRWGIAGGTTMDRPAMARDEPRCGYPPSTVRSLYRLSFSKSLEHGACTRARENWTEFTRLTGETRRARVLTSSPGLDAYQIRRSMYTGGGQVVQRG